jgi:hypothetical protein
MYRNKAMGISSASDFSSMNIFDYNHPIHFQKTSRDYLYCFKSLILPSEILYGSNWKKEKRDNSVEIDIVVYGFPSKSYRFPPTMTFGEVITNVLSEHHKDPQEYCVVDGKYGVPLNPKHTIQQSRVSSLLQLFILPLLNKADLVVYIKNEYYSLNLFCFHCISLKTESKRIIKKISELKGIIKNSIIRKEKGFEEYMKNTDLTDTTQLSLDTIHLYPPSIGVFDDFTPESECDNGENIYDDEIEDSSCIAYSSSKRISHPFRKYPLVFNMKIGTNLINKKISHIFLNTRGDSPPLKYEYNKSISYNDLKNFLIEKKEIKKNDECLFIHNDIIHNNNNNLMGYNLV